MERLEKILTESMIFDYFRRKGNVHKELQKAVYKITVDSLLSELIEEHKKLLLHEHWHQPDPNGYTTGKNLSLLEVMVDDACFFSMSNPSFPLSTTFPIGDIRHFTGLETEETLSKYLNEINAVWRRQKVASIEFQDGAIKFQIFLKHKK